MLPFEPETIEALRARYSAALKDVFDISEIKRGGVRPGEMRQHVFDCEDGIRLLISRDREDELSPPILHVSASVEDGYRIYDKIKSGAVTPEGFLQIAEGRFALISGDNRTMALLGFSKGARVPHWMIEN